MSQCDICGNSADEFHALCDSCDEQLIEWIEETDTYVMKDGRRYRFVKGYYVLERSCLDGANT